MSRLLEIDGAMFASSFAKRPFRVKHTLSITSC